MLNSHLQLSFLSASMKFKVRNADGCDHMPLPPGVTGTVGKDDFIVAFTSSQHVEVLGERRQRKHVAMELDHHEKLPDTHPVLNKYFW